MSEASGTSSIFKRNIVLLLIINLLIKPIYVLFIEAEVQNVVGPNEYGTYFGLLNFCMLFNMILDLGIQNYNSKFVAQNRSIVSSHFANVLGTKLILVILFLATIGLGGLLIGFPASYFKWLFGIGVILILNTTQMYLRSHFSSLGHYRKEVWLSGLDKLLIVLALGYFLYIDNTMSIDLFIQTQIIVIAFSSIITLILLSRLFKIRLHFSLDKSLSLLRKTLPYALVLLLMTLFTRLDGVMLERLLDDQAYSAGVYAAGFRLMDAANMIGILFASLLLPMFANALGENKSVQALFANGSQFLFFVSSVIVLICVFYGDQLIHALYDDATDNYVRVFKYLMVAFWAMSNSSILGCLFLASGKLKSINMLFVLGIVVNFSLNLFLIPKHMAFGAVIATIITQYLVFVGMYILASQSFSISYWNKSIFAALSAVIIVAIACFGFYKYVQMVWIMEALLIGIISLIVSFFTGIFRLPNSQYLESK